MTLSSSSPNPRDPAALTPEPLDAMIAGLTPQEQADLRQRHPVVTRVSRRFITRVVIAASTDCVWTTLTDYGHFEDFLPTVVSSRVIESEGDRHIVEQIDSRTILFTAVKTTVRTENIQIPKKRINFRLIGGDMNRFDGHWQLYAVSVPQAPNANHTLLLQSAEVDAGPVFFERIVHSLITDSLKANIVAIRDEAERRSRA